MYSCGHTFTTWYADNKKTMAKQLLGIGGLTFFKDYRGNGTSLNADFSVGSPTATYTAARSASAPSTYVDGAGVVQLLTDANVRRRQGSYYDATGFHVQSGEMIEAAGTNLFDYSYFDEIDPFIWVYNAGSGGAGVSIERSTERTPPYGTYCLKFVGVGATHRFYNGVAGITSGNKYTVSGFLRGSGDVYLMSIGSTTKSGTKITLQDNYWARYSFTFTADDTAEYAGVILNENNNVTCYAADFQLEASPYMTSFIPTTTAALTRPKDGTNGLYYASAGNRTNAEETIFIKYAPSWAAASQANAVYLHDSDADIIDTAFVTASDSFQYRPNGTDDAANVALAASDPAVNTSYVMAMVSYGATAGTNAEIYVDGVSKGTTTTNYTAPEIGTNFYIGSKADASLQISGIVQAVVIYNRALSAAEVLAVTNILNSGAL